ncbi:redoxin domain-containing protein [Paraherbaspirillum soli]|uniref:Redoxin domain-containing protein n=1 Tax=Paraherbaspirillum soli TaxID=631222 RepID=A0ABW0M6E1_9BURK
MAPKPAPELQVSQWFNTQSALDLETLRGKVVVINAFQILCQGCVHQSVPQMKRMVQGFDPNHVAVLGLHTVFEHHEAMTPEALETFIHRHRLELPIGVDMADGKRGLPLTMQAYHMQGTPTLILIDKNGYLRMQRFGHKDDLSVGVAVGKLLAEPASVR